MSRRGQIVRRAGQECRAELVKLIKQAAYKHAVWEIWQDLMFMGAAALAQPCQWKQEREDEYMRRISKYDKATQGLFPLMFAEIVAALESEGCADVLGGIYMELELGNHWNGQFFTPDSVCRAMARINSGAEQMKAEIESKGYISVNDCCCGGGAMLIAFADECKTQGIDFQHDVLFVGQDVDPVVAHMCYIQMSLLGMPGYVIIGNTLAADFSGYDYWFTPLYFLHGFTWRRQRLEELPDTQKALTVTKQAESVTEQAEAVIDAPVFDINLNETGTGQLAFNF